MMAGRKVAVNVTTPDETGRMVTYTAGTEVPAGVADQITNPKVWGDEDEAEPKPTAKSGRRSSRSSSE